MAYVELDADDLAVDKALPTDLMLQIKDNFDYLFNRAAGLGGAMNLISNGSFENTDAITGYPSDWTVEPGSNGVSASISNNNDEGYKSVHVNLVNANDCILTSALGEISAKLPLKWGLRSYFYHEPGYTEKFKVKISYDKGDGTASAVTPDVDGSSYPQPGSIPINAYATAGAGYIEYDFSTAPTILPHGYLSAWRMHSLAGLVFPPSDARYFKMVITVATPTGPSATVYLDGAYAVQPNNDERDYVTASDTLRISLDAEKLSEAASIVYTEAKRFIMYQAGIYRIKFDLATTKGTYIVYGQLFKNGVPWGTERSTSSLTPTTYSEDLWAGPGDVISVYIKTHGDVTSPVLKASVTNYRIYFDEAKTYGHGKDVL